MPAQRDALQSIELHQLRSCPSPHDAFDSLVIRRALRCSGVDCAMLNLRTDQVAELADHRFERRLIQVISEVDPTAPAVLSSPEGLAMRRVQCRRARGFGMSTERDLGRCVVTAWLMGLDFHTRLPAMAEVLASDRLSPAQKADAIERISTAVLFELPQGRAQCPGAVHSSRPTQRPPPLHRQWPTRRSQR